MARKITETPAPETHSEAAGPESLNEQIAALAHALWQERGCPEGSPEEDWLKAEQEIRERLGTAV